MKKVIFLLLFYHFYEILLECFYFCFKKEKENYSCLIILHLVEERQIDYAS